MFLWIKDALVWVINAVIAAIGAILAGVAGLFPSLPAVPDPPQWLQGINFFFPVGAVLSLFATFLGLYVAFLLARVVLRWVKAL